MAMAENKFVQLHPHDNVIVCCQSAQKGEQINIANQVITLDSSVTIGHKIACQDIADGEQILKYGASIGSATKAIKTGQHVHLHNMKSDYIASHTRHSVTGE